jgi:hypothetical protein
VVDRIVGLEDVRTDGAHSRRLCEMIVMSWRARLRSQDTLAIASRHAQDPTRAECSYRVTGAADRLSSDSRQ